MSKKENFLWEKFYTKEELKVNIPNMSLYTYMRRETKNYASLTALNYFGRKISFKLFWDYIDKCASALKSLGVKSGDVVSILMPNTPEAVISFFAVNKIGAISNMIHPLSAEEEVKEYIVKTKSKILIALNSTYSMIKNIVKDTHLKKVIIASPSDSMPIILNTLYNATSKDEKVKEDSLFIFWKKFIKLGSNNDKEEKGSKDSIATYLHSGGTTGIPKTISLSNRSIIGVNEQAKVFFPEAKSGDSLLLILPIFHCLGLVVGMFIPICRGATSILIPKFDAKRFDKLLTKYHPNFLLGVPTLFEAMLKNKHLEGVNLSYLKGLISGGDTLSPGRSEAINKFLKSHQSKAKIIQGYGMTETTGPVTFGTKGSAKLGSVGIPLPGNIVRICNPQTYEELKPNEVGEICIHSFVVMDGYLNDKKATKDVFKMHDDGRLYIHTGDLGYMDEDGVIFYVQRIKRIIISSGYNIYPEYIERVLKDHKYIKDACVVGIPHSYKQEIAKAFIILEDGVEESYTIKKEIMDYASKNLAHYMLPREYIYKKEFPKTKLDKTDYLALRDELIKKD